MLIGYFTRETCKFNLNWLRKPPESESYFEKLRLSFLCMAQTIELLAWAKRKNTLWLTIYQETAGSKHLKTVLKIKI